MLTNATQEELHQALNSVNAEYEGNICFNRLEQQGRRVRFTLKVHDSHKPGSRLGHSGRHLACACWHAHGHFFDKLFDTNPDAWIRSGKQKITKDGGNWEDRNIGSMMFSLYFSEACECDDGGELIRARQKQQKDFFHPKKRSPQTEVYPNG